ncbi:protein containing diguanylate cyclase (GGDEF) domain [Anaerolinea thermolimosa]|nr:GAF domain-containing protein [Anaerolinea thermolimosa]GAP05425.1 protein containing diguanylate cyclase (GGDEF) domain [Anaerolinea thermolimosa]
MNVRIRFSWLVVFSLLAALLASFFSQWYQTNRQIAVLKQTFAESEQEVTHAVVDALTDSIQWDNWGLVVRQVGWLQQATRAQRLMLLRENGQVIVESRSGGMDDPLPAALITEALDQGHAFRWKPKGDVLQVAVRIPAENPQQARLLLREVTLQPELLDVRLMQFEGILRSVLLALVLGFAAVGLLWTMSVLPLGRLHDLALRISQGDWQLRAGPHALAELDDLSRALNQMLDRIEEQQRELEALNRSLELTVAERTAELEQANRDLAQRAAGLEMLNRVIASASSAFTVHELAENSLRLILPTLGAEFGWIVLDGKVVAASYPEEFRQLADQVMGYVHTHYDVRLAVQDWMKDALPPEQAFYARDIVQNRIRTSVSMAIRAGQQAIGRIDLASLQPRQWVETDLHLLEIIGQQLGVAFQRLQDFQESRENSRLMSRLAGLASLLNRPLSVNEVIDTIGNGLIDLSGASRAAIFQRDSEGTLSALWTHHLPARLVRSLLAREKASPGFFLPVSPAPEVIECLDALPEEPRSFWQQAGGGIQGYAAWPLATGGDPMVSLVCFHDRPVAYSAIQKEVLEAFSRQAAIALRNARLLQAEHEQRVLAEALRDVTAALSSTLEFEEVIDRLLENLEKVVAHDGANLMMLEDDMLRMVRKRGRSQLEPQAREWRYPLSQFKVMERAYSTGQVVIIPDTWRESEWVHQPESSWIRSFATAPVHSRGKVIGFVNVSSAQPGFYHEKHSEPLQAFANQASVAMENARLYQATRTQAEETNTLLRALAPLFAAGSDLATVAEEITRAMVQEFNRAHCGLLLVDRERQQLNLFREGGDMPLGSFSLPLDGPGLTVAAVRSGEVVYAPDVSRDPRYINADPHIRSELVVPLIAGGEVIGALNLESPELDAFDESRRRMLVTFAERAAWVVANAQLLESTRKTARQLMLLNEITQLALAGGEASGVLKEVIRRVAALVDADGAYMTAWEEETRQTIPLAAYGPNADLYTQDIPEPGEINLTFTMMRDGRSVVVEDIRQSSIIPPHVASIFPITSLLGVPLKVNQQKLGGLLVGFVNYYQFTPSEIAVIEQAAGQIALILARMNALHEAERRAAESERLRQAGLALTTTLDLGEVAQLIIQHLETLIAFDTAVVYLYTPEGIRPLAYRNIPMGEAFLRQCFPKDDPLQRDLEARDQPLLLTDAQSDPRFKNWGETYSIRSWMGILLRAGNETIGTIALGRTKVQPFTSAEALLAQLYSHQAGMALQNAVLHSHQQQLAMTDPLTGLYNRRGFFELARHELERSRRFNRPLTLLIADIDHFKLVNDRYGHPVGDGVLRELARRFRSVMREVDLIGRYGGEEFCFVLPESGCQPSCPAAERLLEVVRSRPFQVGEVNVTITISIGVTTLTEPTISLEALVKQADEALYRAKANGRDRLEYWRQVSLDQSITDAHRGRQADEP